MRVVRSVSVSTRGHSHMRGLGPQDGGAKPVRLPVTILSRVPVGAYRARAGIVLFRGYAEAEVREAGGA